MSEMNVRTHPPEDVPRNLSWHADAYARLSGALLDIATQSSDPTAVEVALDALSSCAPCPALACEIAMIRKRMPDPPAR